MDTETLPWPSFPIPGFDAVLRPWLAEDVPGLFAAASESIESVEHWLPWCRPGYALSDSEAWVNFAGEGWRAGEVFAFALVDQALGEIWGGMGLNQLNHERRSANLGYWVRASRQGQGLAPAAVPLIAGFGFDTLGLDRVEIVCAVGNIASRRCAKKAGARFEAIAPQRLMTGDQPTDAAIYVLTRPGLDQPAEQS